MRLIEVRNRDAGDLLSLLSQVQDVSFTIAKPPTTQQVSSGTSPRDPETAPVAAPAMIAAAAALEDATPTLAVDEATNTIVAVGRPSELDRLEALVARLDRRQPQVMIEVTLVSLSENRALDFGVELKTQFENGGTTTNLASAFGLAADGALAAGTGFTGTIIRPGDFEVVVRALETTSSGRAVSVPKILVDNNQSSTLRSVVRQPFTSLNASDTVATTSFGGTEDAGTTITVTPHIAQGDHLSVAYAVEVSAFTGDSISTEGGGVIPPPSQQNSIDGSVTIPDGFAVVVGGLRSESSGVADARVPLLGRIPLLGPLFGTHGDNDTSSRLYIFIQATILRDSGFEGLRNLSASDLTASGVDDGLPTQAPMWIE
jgi:general secretion pathway protein D